MRSIKMNKTKSFCLLYLTLVLLCCGIVSTQAKATPPQLTPVQTTVGGINVSVDPRIELLSVVQMLSTYQQNFGLMTHYEFSYKQDVLDYFGAYTSHEAVTHFNEMSANGFNYDAPPTLMLHLDQSFKLDAAQKVDPQLIARAGEIEQVQNFVKALEQFAQDTNFHEFYLQHQDFYQKMIEQVGLILKQEDYITQLENYYGMHNTSYNIILAPLHRGGGFGPSLTNEDESHVYSILGPIGVVDQLPVFGDKQNFEYLVWHEFSHSFINPLTAHYQQEILQSEALFTPIAKQMARLAYSNWEISLNEHLIRTITARRNLGEDTLPLYEQTIKDEKRQGFFYIEMLSDKLASYEANREKYPTFAAFYPEIVALLAQTKVETLGEDFYTLPFEGPINAALQTDGELVVIRPTQEDASVQASISDYCVAITNLLANKLGIQATLISDKDALTADLSDKNIVVYGTLEGNLWIKQHQTQLPFTVATNKIVSDQVYEGTHLRLITALPHPSNTTKGLLIYTAQQSEDLMNINSVNHGMTDYVVANGETILGQGYYLKDENGWKYPSNTTNK